ncbi:MAG: hypothetical protein H0W25_07485 [Acidimicrobiia bacterium]|nr:hypothetical protein [Acidimicrobiia bacterium]
MYTNAEMLYALTKATEADRMREAEYARMVRTATASHPSWRRRVRSLVRSRPAVPPDLEVVVPPQPEASADNPWGEAA